MDKSKFFAALRSRSNDLFGTSLSQGQVDGINSILRECENVGCDLGQAAYILATAHGESGGKMRAVRENMNYSAGRISEVFGAHRRQGRSPRELAGKPQLLANTVYGGEWGLKNLGNTRPNDGWDLRGFFVGQITGRTNLHKWANGLGVSPDFLLSKLDDLEWSTRALVRPMMEGWATGQSLPAYVLGPHRNYVGARAVWNGSFEAKEYARKAKLFERALEAGGWSVEFGPKKPQRKTQHTTPRKRDWLTALLGLFRKGKN